VKNYFVLPMLAVLASTMVLSLFVTTSALAQDTPHSEDTAQHDGGDRAEYLQELEHSDPLFYVPRVNETSSQAQANITPPN
jgi:hypothetical protein